MIIKQFASSPSYGYKNIPNEEKDDSREILALGLY